MPAEDSPFSGTTRVLTVDVAQARAVDVAAALRAILARLPDHPGILSILDAGVADGRVFIVTPRVTGEPLEAALRVYGPAALADALPRLQQLADALDVAAADGLSHGNLAPSDIIVSGDETRIVGIGVGPALLRAGISVPVASPYAAPEVVQGGERTPVADQFSLAVITYEWLFGCRPGLTGSAMRAVSLPGLDTAQLTRAFATATASVPEHRFSNCSAFVQAVAESSKVLEFSPPADDLWLYGSEAPGVTANTSPRDGAGAANVNPPRARPVGRIPIAAALAVGVVVGVAAVWMYVRRGETQATETGQEYTDAAIDDAHAGPGEVAEPVVTPPRDDIAPIAPVSREPTPGPVRVSNAASASQLDAGLLVHSTPAGALVAIDGSPRGTTPVAVRGLELGARSVIVSLAGYRAVARQIVLTSERPSRAIEIDLAPVSRSSAAPSASVAVEGSLVIDSRPAGATVSIDGRVVGVTPLTLMIAPGAHTVRLEHAGYRPVTTRVDVKSGERARVAARLEGGQDEQ